MARPDDATLAAAAQRALGLHAPPRLGTRRVLHAARGRAAERVEIDGRPVAVKWRDDRPQNREALLYRCLTPAVLRTLGAPDLLGATTVVGTHLLFLAWMEGAPADWENPRDVRMAFAHLGRVHAATARLIPRAPEALAFAEAWPELLPERSGTTAQPGEPFVLDPGDLHAGNFLFPADGGVCLLDFENMAVRPRDAALRPLWEDGSLPQGDLADLALSAYWTAAGWPDDAETFRARALRRR